MINDEVSFEVKERFRKIAKDCYEGGMVLNTKFRENNMMTIQLNKPTQIQYNPRRLSVAEKEKLMVILDDLLERGIIRQSNSEFSSPIVMVKKKSGEMRLCVDYRDLNSVTVKDNFPIPHIEDQVAALQNMNFFSTIDLKNAYHQIKMNPESVKYTAFTTPMGIFEYVMCPYGLKNGPSVFQRIIFNLFSDLIRQNKVSVYLDDIVIPSKELDEHLETLGKVHKLCTWGTR